jgi:hypothetical protein
MAHPTPLCHPPPKPQVRRNLHTYSPSQLVAVASALASYPPGAGAPASTSGWHPGRLFLFDFITHSSPPHVMSAWSGRQAAAVLWAFSRFRLGRGRGAETRGRGPPAQPVHASGARADPLRLPLLHACCLLPGMCLTEPTCARCWATCRASSRSATLMPCPWRCGAWRRCSSSHLMRAGWLPGATRPLVRLSALGHRRWHTGCRALRRCGCSPRQSSCRCVGRHGCCSCGGVGVGDSLSLGRCSHLSKHAMRARRACGAPEHACAAGCAAPLRR